MFILALVYLIILVILIVFTWRDRSYPGAAATVLFTIIGFVLFFKELNR